MRLTRKTVLLIRHDLTKWDMQSFEPLASQYSMTAVGSWPSPYDPSAITLPVKRLPSISAVAQRLGPVARGGVHLLRRRLQPDRLLGLSRLLSRVDIAHVAELGSPIAGQAAVAAPARTRMIVTCWENIPFLGDESPDVVRAKSLVRDRASVFLAVTESAREALLLEGVPARLVRIVRPGVDQTKFRPMPRDDQLAATWGVEPGANVVLFCGRLIPEKGLLELLLAFQEVVLRAHPTHLVMIGNGPSAPKVKAVASKLGIANKVTVVPGLPYSEMPRAYNTADLFVLPTLPTPVWQEQFGLVLAEAMSCGKAVVTTRSGSVPDVVGDAAETVEPYDYMELATTMVRILHSDEERRALATAARARATELFDVRTTAGEVAKVYAEFS